MTESPCARVTVNCKVCGNSGSAVLPVVSSCVCKVSVNPIIQPTTRLISHTQTLTRDNIHTRLFLIVGEICRGGNVFGTEWLRAGMLGTRNTLLTASEMSAVGACLPCKLRFRILYRRNTYIDLYVMYCLFPNLFGEAVSTAYVMNSAEVNCPDVWPFNTLLVIIFFFHCTIFLLLYRLRWSDHSSSCLTNRSVK
jgi:hypothetical protein